MKKSEKPLHDMPADLKKMVESSKEMKEIWKTITPLGKNEWICWVTSAKKEETRSKRIEVGKSKLLEVGLHYPWVERSFRQSLVIISLSLRLFFRK